MYINICWVVQICLAVICVLWFQSALTLLKVQDSRLALN